MSKHVFTVNFSEPLNGLTAARVDIHAGDGNLTVDRLASGEPALASGALQYIEGQEPPARSLALGSGQDTLTLKGSMDRRPRFHLPWSTCNGATEWQIHLNPTIALDVLACTHGGNLKLDLTGLTVQGVSADTGGGNVEVVLPDNAANLSLSANSGAGNVSVSLPGGVAARIHASTGLGKAIVDPRFSRIDKTTYQSPGYEHAAERIEVTLNSGAGNVIVTTR
jgi:hypothetical protein